MSLKWIKAINEGNIDGVKTLLDEYNLLLTFGFVEILLINVMKSDTPAKNEIFTNIVEYTDFDFSQRIHQKSRTPLMRLVCLSIDDLHMVLKYVKEEDIDLWDDEDESALYMAVKKYHNIVNCHAGYLDENLCKNIIIELLKHNANPLRDFCSKSSIRFIIEYNMFDLLIIFIEHCRHDISFEAVHYSILVGNYDFIEFLIGRVDINQVDENGRTLLEYATMVGAGDDIVELLRVSNPHPGVDK